MAKEWVLNQAFNRWQLNRPRYVGKLSEAIRRCAPRSLEEWERHYYDQVRPTGQVFGADMRGHLAEVGRLLYSKISEHLRAELDAVTEEDCIAYVRETVIERTYEGYVREKETVYGQLQQALGVELQPAPDEWDRRFNVDFLVPVGDRAIGIQIKPITYQQTPELHQWREWMSQSHQRFQREKGGQVFIVFSVTEGRQKRICNPDIIAEIRAETERLKATADR